MLDWALRTPNPLDQISIDQVSRDTVTWGPAPHFAHAHGPPGAQLRWERAPLGGGRPHARGVEHGLSIAVILIKLLLHLLQLSLRI